MLKNFLSARFIVAAMLTLALTFMAASPIVSARSSNINYEITSVNPQNGRVTVNGYFNNTGNAGANVTALRFRGYIGGVYINASAENMSVWVGANSRVNYSVTVWGDGITSRTSTNFDLNVSVVYD